MSSIPSALHRTSLSPATATLFEGALSSAQMLPAPLYLTSPPIAGLSPLPFALLGAARPSSDGVPAANGGTGSVLSTPQMISLAFGGALSSPCVAIMVGQSCLMGDLQTY